MYDYKIVIVDDNPAVLQSLKLVLEWEFASVVTLQHPNQLLPTLSEGEADVILLDMNFSAKKLDGEEGLNWLKFIKKRPDPPAVVLITAFGNIDLATTSMKEGAEDFITKPWDNKVLIEKLLAAIDKRTEQQRTETKLKNADNLMERRETTRRMTLDAVERRHIMEMLEECDGNLSETAKRLDINRMTLYNKLKKYGIIA